MASKNTEVAVADNAPPVWQPPKEDAEFEFKDIGSAPSWIDKGWASYSMGPALAVPVGDPFDTNKPYTTQTARVGDIVKFVKAKGSTLAHFEVLQGEVDPQAAGATTVLPPQQTNAALEDLIRLGWVAAANLSQATLDQVVARSPGIRPYLATPDGTGASIPAVVTVPTYVKVA